MREDIFYLDTGRDGAEGRELWEDILYLDTGRDWAEGRE